MTNPTHAPTLLSVTIGYLAAVSVATAVAATIMANHAPHGAPFLAILLFGGFYVLFTGLPGFGLTVALARRHNWSGWLPFTLCGGLNVILAWLLVGGLTGGAFNGGDQGIFLASLRRGVADGVAYWWVAYHGLGRRNHSDVQSA